MPGLGGGHQFLAHHEPVTGIHRAARPLRETAIVA
jgi:hypothetical protein